MPRMTDVQCAGWLAGIGAWNMAVPFIGDVLGLDVNVRTKVEVVDHVVPGLLIALSAGYLLVLARRGPWSAQRPALFASGLAFLAGFWVLATHVPLIADAADGTMDWGAAIWHTIASLPIVALALVCVVRSIPADA